MTIILKRNIDLNQQNLFLQGIFSGNFRGNPVTPGVILLESLPQVGIVAFALYLLSKEYKRVALKKLLALFTEANVEFLYRQHAG